MAQAWRVPLASRLPGYWVRLGTGSVWPDWYWFRLDTGTGSGWVLGLAGLVLGQAGYWARLGYAGYWARLGYAGYWARLGTGLVLGPGWVLVLDTTWYPPWYPPTPVHPPHPPCPPRYT